MRHHVRRDLNSGDLPNERIVQLANYTQENSWLLSGCLYWRPQASSPRSDDDVVGDTGWQTDCGFSDVVRTAAHVPDLWWLCRKFPPL